MFNRGDEPIVTAYQCFLSNTKTTACCGYNTNLNQYEDQQSYYENTKTRYQAIITEDCKRHVRQFIELSAAQLNRTSKPPKPIPLLVDVGQQNLLIRLQGPKQATNLDQFVYGVWECDSNKTKNMDSRSYYK